MPAHARQVGLPPSRRRLCRTGIAGVKGLLSSGRSARRPGARCPSADAQPDAHLGIEFHARGIGCPAAIVRHGSEPAVDGGETARRVFILATLGWRVDAQLHAVPGARFTGSLAITLMMARFRRWPSNSQ